MKKLIFALFLILALASCCTLNMVKDNVKLSPEYQGVDPKLQKLVNEYKELAKIRGYNFKTNVTMGFKKLGEDGIVGICTKGLNFKEIDFDPVYWEYTGESKHLWVVFHEMTHCYCGRDHDYGEGTRFAEAYVKSEDKNAYMKDGCPVSIMYPTGEMFDSCINSHYAEYIEEMFNRCNP